MAKKFSIKGAGTSKKVTPQISGIDAAAAGIAALTKKALKDREYRVVAVTDIKANPQVRTGIAEQKFQSEIEALAASIQADGLLHPILLAQPDPADGKYIVFDGECRLRATQLLGRDTIPAIVTNLTYSEAVDWQLKQIASNLMRTPLTPQELGRSFSQAIQEGVSVTELASRFGKSRAYIQNYLAVYRAPDILQKYFEEQELKDIVTMTTLVHGWEKDQAQFEKLFSSFIAKADGPISRDMAKQLQNKIEAQEHKNDAGKGTSKKQSKKAANWEVSKDCKELTKASELCFRVVVKKVISGKELLLHGTLMSNYGTKEIGKVAFLYEGKISAIDVQKIIRIEKGVKVSEITPMEDFEETATK